MQHYTYVYFSESLVPYYVGTGVRHRWLDKHRVPVPPPERVLRFDQESQEAAFAFESYLIKRIGRRQKCMGVRPDEKIGPLMNRTDGGPGAENPTASVRRKTGRRLNKFRESRQHSRYHANTGLISYECALCQAGKLERKRQTCTVAGYKGVHIQWHVKRGLINPDCELCTAE